MTPESEVSAFGSTMSLVEWTMDKRCLVPMGSVLERLNEGWDAERALTEGPPLKRRRNRFSQYRGVSYDAVHFRWRAHIQINGRPKSLGYFDNEVAAAKAYDRASRPFGRRANIGPTIPLPP